MVMLPKDMLETLVNGIFRACQASPEESACVTDHLVLSSMMGMHSHGLMRVAEYAQLIGQGKIVPGAAPTVLADAPGCTVVDYGWNFGQVAAMDLMRRVMDKARNTGVAYGASRRSAHCGRLGHYAEFAAREGFVSLIFCNSGRHGHFVAPWGGRQGRLATNPIAFGMPTRQEPPVVADFSTAACPEGRIRVQRDQGQMLPDGVILTAEGRPSNDPHEFYGPPRGVILPFGGVNGHRGFALSLLVELMGGLLAGQDMTQESPGNGIGVLAINPALVQANDQFLDIIETMRDYIKNTEPAMGFDEVLLPGEPEHRRLQSALAQGVELPEPIWQAMTVCASELGIALPAECPAGQA